MAIVTRRVFDPTGTIYPNYLRRQFFDLSAAQAPNAAPGPIAPAQGGGYRGPVPSEAAGPGYAGAYVGENRFLPNNRVMLSANDPDARRLAAQNPNLYQMPSVPDSQIARGSTRDAQGNWSPWFGDGYRPVLDQNGQYTGRNESYEMAVDAASERGPGPKMYARGGMIEEPVFGVGQRTGQGYVFGEAGPERVVPQGRQVRPPRGPRRFAGRQYLNRQYLPNLDQRSQALDEVPFALGGKNYVTYTDPQTRRQVVRDESSGVIFEVGGGGLSETLPMSDSTIVADSQVAADPTIQDWVGPLNTDQNFKDELVKGIGAQQQPPPSPPPGPPPPPPPPPVEPQPFQPEPYGQPYVPDPIFSAPVSEPVYTGGADATLDPGMISGYENPDTGAVAGDPSNLPLTPLLGELTGQYGPYTPVDTVYDPSIYGAPAPTGIVGDGGNTLDPGSFDNEYAGPPSPDYWSPDGTYIGTFAPEPEPTTEPSVYDPYALATISPDQYNQLVQ